MNSFAPHFNVRRDDRIRNSPRPGSKVFRKWSLNATFEALELEQERRGKL